MACQPGRRLRYTTLAVESDLADDRTTLLCNVRGTCLLQQNFDHVRIGIRQMIGDDDHGSVVDGCQMVSISQFRAGGQETVGEQTVNPLRQRVA